MSDFYNHLLHLSGKTIDHCLWLDNTGVSNWGKGISLKNARILIQKITQKLLYLPKNGRSESTLSFEILHITKLGMDLD